MRHARLVVIIRHGLRRIPRDKARPSTRRQTSLSRTNALLRINYPVSRSSSLHELWILSLESGEILLSFPCPDTIARKDEIHLFEGTLVGLGIQRPHDDDGEDIDAAKDVECFLVETVENSGEKEDLLRG